eukprot:tig00000073_g1742.t1
MDSARGLLVLAALAAVAAWVASRTPPPAEPTARPVAAVANPSEPAPAPEDVATSPAFVALDTVASLASGSDGSSAPAFRIVASEALKPARIPCSVLGPTAHCPFSRDPFAP